MFYQVVRRLTKRLLDAKTGTSLQKAVNTHRNDESTHLDEHTRGSPKLKAKATESSEPFR